MSSLPGIIGLIVFVYVRPHEFFEPLKEINFLYIFLALSIGGMAYDVSQRRLALASTPHLKWALLFVLWCIVTLGIRKPSLISTHAIVLVVDLILYVVIAHGIQNIATFKRVLVVVFASGLFVAYVGADQGLSPFQCVVYNPRERNSRGFADGRECRMVEEDGTPHDGTLDCIADGKPGMPYQCERAGLFGTTSVGGGRVRYLGVLLDPNELALATALAVPFAFAFLEMRALVLPPRAPARDAGRRRGGDRLHPVARRAGRLRRRARGLLHQEVRVEARAHRRRGAGRAHAAGGRPQHDESADESTLERLGCAAAGIKMLMSYPFTGVGFSQYTEYHPLTAHNAYVLACGELGLPGMFLFGVLIYLADQGPAHHRALPDAREPRRRRSSRRWRWGCSRRCVGGAVGIFFLSWCYHYVLWIHFGLVGALYTCTKRLLPGLRVPPLAARRCATSSSGYVAFLTMWGAVHQAQGRLGLSHRASGSPTASALGLTRTAPCVGPGSLLQRSASDAPRASAAEAEGHHERASSR